jgi:DNA-binding Lrp family transcriptional regulator
LLTQNEERVLKLLREDCRATIKEMSKDTGIKPSTVYQTINRLRSRGVIEKFTVKLNDKLMQKNFVVIMFVSTTQDISEGFFKNDFVDEVYGITGEYDVLIKFKFRDVEEFNKFIIDFRKDKNIVKTITMVGTTKIKEM